VEEKPLLFLSTEIKTPPFSVDARIQAGILLRRLQYGELMQMPHSKPMPSVGKQCYELRINDIDDDWRIIYHISKEAIVILDIFVKKSNKTPKSVINRCHQRMKRFYDLINEE